MHPISRNCKENGLWSDLNHCWNMYVCNTWNKEIFKIELVGPDHSEKKKNSQKGSKQFKLQEENEIPPNIRTFVYVFIS